MPFPHGSVSFRAYKVIGEAPKTVDQAFLDKLREHTISDDNLPEEVEYGWSGPQHIMDADFSFDNLVFGNAVHFALRIDTNKVPGDVKKALKQMEESARAKENPSGFISKVQKREARDAVAKKCQEYIRDRRYRKSRLVTLLWDLDSGTLYTSAAGSTYEKLAEILERTFKLSLAPSTSGRLAERYAESMGIRAAYEDLRPSMFLKSHASGNSPEYPWVAKGPEPKDFLGNEFFTWLLYHTATGDGTIPINDHDNITIYFDKALELECAFGQSGKQTLRGDAPNRHPEAKAGLREGKVPRNASMIVDAYRNQYALGLRPEVMAFSGVKLPEVEDAETPRVVFEERINFINEINGAMEHLFIAFLRVRLAAGAWNIELAAIVDWIANLK